MWTYNCARVYVGNYSCGHIAFMPQGDTYKEVHCGYEVVEGKTINKRLQNIRVKGATDSLSPEDPYPKKYTILQTYAIYPLTDIAIIRIFNSKGSHLVKLIKHQSGSRSTVFKERL